MTRDHWWATPARESELWRGLHQRPEKYMPRSVCRPL
jgi:hypothetical protein